MKPCFKPLGGLKQGFKPTYLKQALKQGVKPSSVSFPAWAVGQLPAHGLCHVSLRCPNSASCERVFSLLKQMFGNDQKGGLADYMQAVLMRRFNKRVQKAQSGAQRPKYADTQAQPSLLM